MRTVRDAAFDVLRGLGGTTFFSNPGSTEISLLTDLPDDLKFVLALHEGSVVGIATGWAIANDSPAVVILHTTAGLGNAVGALATARVNRAPMVVIVGQQDRRHLALNPFLAGHRLDDLAGDYPVWTNEPARPQDVPGALARAWHEATQHRGPAIVIIPMDDWDAAADEFDSVPAPARVLRAASVEPEIVAEVADFLSAAKSPVMVVGAGTDDAQSWRALTGLAERLNCPVWQEAFGARAGYPQDHPLFAGHLPSGRAELRKVLAEHDVILSVGAPVFRQYPHEAGPLVEPGTRIAVVTDDPSEANSSPADLAVIANPAALCSALYGLLSPRPASPETIRRQVAVPDRPVGDERLTAPHVFAALAERTSRNTVIVEESPSSRPALHALLPAREPLGFLSAAMGGFGLRPAGRNWCSDGATRPPRRRTHRGRLLDVCDSGHCGAPQITASASSSSSWPTVGTRSWTISRRCTVKRPQHGKGAAPWPAFEQVSVSTIADGLGCSVTRVQTYDDLIKTLDEVIPTLSTRSTPLVLEVAVK